jgi:hypothetical protein
MKKCKDCKEKVVCHECGKKLSLCFHEEEKITCHVEKCVFMQLEGHYRVNEFIYCMDCYQKNPNYTWRGDLLKTMLNLED